MTRSRSCIKNDPCGNPCRGPTTESKTCGSPIVNSRMGAFGPWSACSTSCGRGVQRRTRVCIPGNACGMPCGTTYEALSESRSCGGPIVNAKMGAFGAGFCTDAQYKYYMAQNC